MKKIIFIVLILICCFFGVKTWFTKESKVKEEKMMKGWYVEISNSYINVREEPNTYSSLLGKVNEGEKYEVLDINLDNGKYYWYNIEFEKNKSYKMRKLFLCDIAKYRLKTARFYIEVFYLCKRKLVLDLCG